MKRKGLIPGNKELRQRAEQRLAESKPPEIPEVKGSAERLIHHLQVHQVELELQNEELAESRNALEESLAKYTELYEFAPIGYLTVRPDGAIEKANLAAASLLRIERAHLINNLLARFVSSNDLDKLNRFLAGIAEGRDRVTCELGLGSGRTPRRWARLIAGAPMPRSGGLVNTDSVFLLAMEDITQRHQQELELAEVQEDLRAAVRARDNLMAIVSHDLLSPLSAIRLSAELLAATPPQGERRQNRKQLDVIFRAAEGMRRLIGDLLQATAIDTGNFNVDPQPEDVPTILQEVRSAFEPLLASRGICLEMEIPSDLPPVCCDHQRLIQVLSNLVGNAVKFVPDHGRIHLASRIHGDFLFMSVADNGPGISKEQQIHLFERYWKGPQPGRQGFGLGLYISKGIIEAHGGRIWVDSQIGLGTTFNFTIPIAQPTKEPDTFKCMN